MSTAGPNGAGGASGTANGGQAWTNITNVTADDTNYATVAVTAAVFSEYMFTNTFGFAIPSTATINGIQVDLKAKVSTTSANVNLTLSKNGGASGSTSFNTPQVTTTEAFKSYGSSSELWGLTWTPTEVNASTFGFRLWVGQDTNNTWSVNYGRITVTYTPAATGYANLPLLGVGLINTLIHGLTLGLCSWRWRPFTRTQTRTAGVMA